MLGLQETRSSGTPTSKTYSCVACSATFQSLASLLVHQASHADEIACQPESTLPTCVTCGTLFSSADLLEKHNCVAVPTPAAQEMHVCDCGEEFDALSALEEHKMLHKPDEQVSMSLDINPQHLETELDNITDSGHSVLDQASPNCSPCPSNEDPLVKTTCSASETDINDMVPTTDTSTVEENVKSASASEAEIETASITEISIPMKEQVKSASTSEADIEMASTTEILIPTKEHVKSSSSASEADIEMASATDTSVPMEENVKSSSSASEADIKMASATDTSVLMEENVKSSSSASEADIKMASTTDRSVPMEVDVKSSSSASEAEIKDMASTTDRSIPAEKNIVNQQDEDILKPHESLLPHSVTEKEPILENNSDTFESSNTSNHPEHDSEESASSHKESTGCDKKSILKILASAYMSHRQTGHINQVPTKRNQPPRKVAPRAPMQFAPAITMPKSEPQKKESNTNCPERVLSFPRIVLNLKTGKKKKKKRKKIISVIQTLYPVVMLETRQKLFGKDKIEGRHKCGICRRVFQNPDNLIMHHAQHKKERVKFCFRCQQFVICAAENHRCFSTFAGNSQCPPVVKNKSPTLPRPSPATAQRQRKFQCSICKRAYIWKRNLTRHNLKGKCTPILSSSATAVNQDNGNPASNSNEPSLCSIKPLPNSVSFPPNFIKLHSKNDSSSEVQASKVNEISKHVNVGVGTETIKTEELNTEFSIERKNQTLLKIPSPSHKPVDQLPSPSFVSNSKPAESTKTEQNVELPANVVETEAEDQDQYEEKQWTMPLDDAEIDVLIDGDQEDMDNEDNFADVAKKDSNEDEDVVIVESPDDLEMDSLCPSNGFNVHVSDEGIKRFVCAGCQRSYSRRFTMMQHLSICGARKLKHKSSGVPGPLRRFPCPQCGKFFSRKDNMNMHRKRCSGTIPNPPIVPSIVENKTPPAQENLFVLSPSTETPSVRPESSRSSSSNWGIMSLPPVLPRRVTCECGASFTCPRLLFEHLQLHAQESYICPHCGENLQSWMDFEAHQQVHRQSQNQAVEQRGPQMHPRPFPQMTQLHVPTPQQPRPFSQVLQSPIPSGLQQPPGFQTSEINPKAQPSALLPPQKLNHSPYPETVTCYRCKKTFSGRRSLLRHLRLSCRGDAAGPKKTSVQIPSNASKPTFKPLRCPVCVRWFSCLDGLKRHLVSHSRQPTLSCQQCGQNCPSYQALEEHKRNVHKVNSGIVSANVKQEQVCKGAQSAQKNTPTDFQCHICLRYYPKLQSLKDHVRKVHRPKLPKPINLTVVDPFRSGQFQCQICMRAYPDIKSLKNHRRRVHRILGGVFQSAKGTEQNRTPDHFQCQICGSSYPDISALQNHKRTAHRVFGGLELGNHSAKPTQSVQVSNLQLS